MTTKATRDVIDLAVRPVTDFILTGTGTSSIDSTPIGASTPDVGFFTNLQAGNLTISTTANFTGATVIGLQSFYADLAEYYEADEELAPGTVVDIGGEKEVTKSSDTVFGIVSDTPAFVMNQQALNSDKTHVPVVLTGRTPCLITGSVSKGDFIVMSHVSGVGTKRLDNDDRLTFARSLVDDNGTGIRLVEVVAIAQV